MAKKRTPDVTARNLAPIHRRLKALEDRMKLAERAIRLAVPVKQKEAHR